MNTFDAITDQSLTVLECRALVATLFSGPVPATYRAALKNLANKAARGAACETREETLSRRLQESAPARGL
jgi:hypothetical protein|tara:strand:+ start:8472 stop:8684 length:213 start_codon:yes stop_codon:yes gene_type:complete